MTKSLKSLQPHVSDEDRAKFSDLLVLNNPDAGYFVGSTFPDANGIQQPATRDSPYYATQDEATAQLAIVAAYNDSIIVQP